jgi:DNA-binding MarR family transcriptional regulator
MLFSPSGDTEALQQDPRAPFNRPATVQDSQDHDQNGSMDLRQLSRAMAVLGALDPGAMPLHHAQVLLLIAQGSSCTYREIEVGMNLSNASVSRTIDSLAESSNHRKTSLGLVEKFIDPAEGRRYRVRLTRKGHALIRAIEAIT